MSAGPSPPRQQLVALGEMPLIPRLEENATERFRAGHVAGFLSAIEALWTGAERRNQ